MKKIFSFGICIILSLSISAIASAASWQWINAAQVQGKMRETRSLWLIDVRNEFAYADCHIEGAVNIPAGMLAHKKFPQKKMLVLLDGALGQKTAREAADALTKNGHERIFILEGGVVDWKMNGFQVVETRITPRGVNPEELKWALEKSVPLKLYDMRDAKEQKAGMLKNSEAIAGETIQERVEKLKSMLPAKEKSKNLSEKIQKSEPVVIVFSAKSDAESLMQKLMLYTNADIRYLIGGYESMDPKRAPQTMGTCPTCPKKSK